MPFINGGQITDDSAALEVVDAAPAATEAALGGFYYEAGTAQLHVSYDAVDPTDTFVRGIAVSQDGRVRCVDTPGAVPADVAYIGGLAIKGSTGQLCTDTVGPATQYPHGWPTRDDGVVVVTTVVIPDFMLMESGDKLLLESGDDIIL